MTNKSKREEKVAAMNNRVAARVPAPPPPGLDAEAWAQTSEVVRAFLWRREIEIRDGYAQRIGLIKGSLDDDAKFADAEAAFNQGLENARAELEALRPFEQMAQRSGITLAEVCERYFGMDALLRRNFVEGVRSICANLGLDPQKFGQAMVAHADAMEASANVH